MAEVHLYINRRCHTGRLRDAARDLAGKTIDLISIAGHRLQDVASSNSAGVSVLRVQKALASQEFPEPKIKSWEKADGDLCKVLGEADVPIDPMELDRKIGEFLVPIGTFREASRALYYLTSLEKVCRFLPSADSFQQMGSMMAARRLYFVNRVFRFGLLKNEWVSRPEVTPDEEITELFSLTASQAKIERKRPIKWWEAEAAYIAPPHFSNNDRTTLKDSRSFHLGRLEHFLHLVQMAPTDFPGWKKQASQAVLGSYRDCVTAGLEDEAIALLQQFTNNSDHK